MINVSLTVGLWFLICMILSIVLYKIVEKRYRNNTGEILIINGSNACFRGDNNVLASLKMSWLSEANSNLYSA